MGTVADQSQKKISSCCVLVVVAVYCCIALLANNEDSHGMGIGDMIMDGSYMRRLLLSSDEEHKTLFPLESSDWWGTILMTLGLLVAASGGIGGGGILVPLFILVFQFKPRYAIPLSNFCILASSITNMTINIPLRHPLADRPLVDWDLVLVMEPLTMAGAIVGAFLSKILPDWFLVVSLVFLLAFTTWTTMRKGISQWKKESVMFQEEQRSALAKVNAVKEEDDEEAESQPLLSSSLSIDATKPQEVMDPELKAILETEKSTPWDKVQLITIMVIGVIALNLLKGGSSAKFSSPLGVSCGSFGYWFLTGSVLVWIVGISWYARDAFLLKEWALKKRLRYKYLEGDVEWNSTNTVIYPGICFFSGVFAGLFGIGGGIVKGPLMLHMGVHPLVASATSAVMTVFTSAAATTMFIAFGTLTWDYAWYFFVISLLATVVGQYGVSYLVEKYRRVSLVSLSIGAVIAISTVLMAIQSVFSLIDSDGKSQSSSVCSK